MLFIRDLSKSWGMEVYRVEKSNVWMEVALSTPKSLIDDSKFVEVLSFHILLTPVWLVFILQYFSSPASELPKVNKMVVIVDLLSGSETKLSVF